MSRRYFKHEPGEIGYVDPYTRVCEKCPASDNTHPLQDFPTNGTHYATMCKSCQVNYQNALAKRNMVVTTEFAATLKKARTAKVAGVPYAELLEAVCAPFGGEVETFRQGGRLMKAAIDRAKQKDATNVELELGIKAFAKLMDAAGYAEKVKPPQLDFRDMDEAQTAELLFEIIAANDGIRSILFGNPVFRDLYRDECNVLDVVPEGSK